MKRISEKGRQTHLPASDDNHEWWMCMTDRFADPTAVAIASGMNKEISRLVPEDILVL
jgi:hypothetical protein